MVVVFVDVKSDGGESVGDDGGLDSGGDNNDVPVSVVIILW